ncbi:maleylpyruvate isomerase family mycothiol-dependent enzyme [Mobilicoccus caccae]|uniref:TIGR03085 family protein n=1 Tax=Mobilicoccus caccae TaxID=1859295 RepID=A0ABQ6IVF9_9MICO|nr:maleylpyruvate isomerase family mycothiol-dependent enzyme [Mobilicoccus caccae]GMA41935.1 TIGR03085 family protein [Mobilicoccus caccae]
MTAALRDRQKDRFCDALAAVEATAPTLCEGWDAHDLAIHLWILKHDPASWPGDFLPVPPLQQTSRERARRIRERWTYADLIERLRADPGSIACMPLDALEGHRHALGEYFMHTLDITRANGLPEVAPDDELEDALWRRVKAAALALHLVKTPGLVLRRPNGDSARIGPRWRGREVVVTGEPGELMCWVYGRGAVADVTVERR